MLRFYSILPMEKMGTLSGHALEMSPSDIHTFPKLARKLSAAATDNDHVEKLLLNRQVPLDLDDERRPGEEIGEQQAKQRVPVAQMVAALGHRERPALS
jgi:hypothetical protein